MTTDADGPILITESPPRLPSHGWFVSGVLRLLTGLIAAVCALFVTNNWCFVIFPATLAALVVDYLLCAFKPRFVVRVLTAMVVGVTIGIFFGVGPDWAFREAFEMAPPNGIHDVRIWRHYLGGPGEHLLIIEFMADAAALQALAQAHPPTSDSYYIHRWKAAGGSWAQALDIFGTPVLTSFAYSSWKRIRPLEHPVVLALGATNRGTLVLFQEQGSSRCVALHVRF